MSEKGTDRHPFALSSALTARGAVPQGSTLGLAAKALEGHMEGKELQSRGPPMTTFDDREHAFEAKFAHDAEMQFKAEARRNKLVALWAAGLLGKSDADAQAYVAEVIAADFEEAGIEDVVRKVAGDLGAKSSADEVRAKMAEMLPVAKSQLMSEN